MSPSKNANTRMRGCSGLIHSACVIRAGGRRVDMELFVMIVVLPQTSRTVGSNSFVTILYRLQADTRHAQLH